MIITPDCDQFNTVVAFGHYSFTTNSNSMMALNFYFLPRELFNMIQLQILHLRFYIVENKKFFNAVPINLRRNLRNIRYHSLLKNHNYLYINILTNYLNGINFTFCEI